MPGMVENNLPYLCKYLCNLQGRILKSEFKSNQLTLDDINEINTVWQYFTKKSMAFIKRLIDFYSEKLDDILKKLKDIKISSHLEVENILNAMQLYEKYISLVFQIKLEIDYLETGAIKCKGHHNEMLLLNAKMDRSTNLDIDGMKGNKKMILKGHIDENVDQIKEFSCLSLEGIRVLHTQFSIRLKASIGSSGISLKQIDLDMLYDPQVDNLRILRARVLAELFDRSKADMNNLNCIFYRKNIGDNISTMKVSYGIKNITKPKIVEVCKLKRCEETDFYCKRKIPATPVECINIISLKRKRS